MKKKRLDDFPHRGRWSQILLRMKLTFVLVFCMLVQTFAAVNAQTVTLKKQNASLEEIIWELKEQTKRVARGWFPQNSKRKQKMKSK